MGKVSVQFWDVEFEIPLGGHASIDVIENSFTQGFVWKAKRTQWTQTYDRFSYPNNSAKHLSK